MRLLHTADWHVGKSLARRSRLDESRAVLDEIVGIAERERVDAVLVCGDVFDQTAPSADAEKVVYGTLLALREAGIPTVVIAGNHDHPERWRAVAGLLERIGVTVMARVRSPAAGGMTVLRGADGSECEVVGLPWLSERYLVTAEDLMGLEGQPYDQFSGRLGRVMDGLCAAFTPGRCHVLAGHLFVDGARLGGGERSLTVGQLYATALALVPVTPQYVALGHVHRAQSMRPAAPVVYAGSPLAFDFSEAEQVKSVTVVDLRPGLPAAARQVPLTAGTPLREVVGTIEELEAFRDLRAHLKVTVRCAGPVPGLGERVRELLPQAVQVRLDYPRQESGPAEAGPALSARELFAGYLRKAYGAEPDPARLDLFERLLEEVDAPAAA